MTAGYWTAVADVLTFPNGCISSSFTLNAQEAQGIYHYEKYRSFT